MPSVRLVGMSALTGVDGVQTAEEQRGQFGAGFCVQPAELVFLGGVGFFFFVWKGNEGKVGELLVGRFQKGHIGLLTTLSSTSLFAKC